MTNKENFDYSRFTVKAIVVIWTLGLIFMFILFYIYG